jgi:hypothetical protein
VVIEQPRRDALQIVAFGKQPREDQIVWMIVEQAWRYLRDKIAVVERGVEIGHIRLGIEQSRGNECDIPAGKESIIKSCDSGALVKDPCRDTRDVLNTRNYKIRFPKPVSGVKFGYAAVANWSGTAPQYHPSHAPEAVGIASHPPQPVGAFIGTCQ